MTYRCHWTERQFGKRVKGETRKGERRKEIKICVAWRREREREREREEYVRISIRI